MIGIYLLKKGDFVVYVGQSKNIDKRISDHTHGDKVFDNVLKIECDYELLDSSERAYILMFNPIYNISK